MMKKVLDGTLTVLGYFASTDVTQASEFALCNSVQYYVREAVAELGGPVLPVYDRTVKSSEEHRHGSGLDQNERIREENTHSTEQPPLPPGFAERRIRAAVMLVMNE
jgi:hypothetical protein